MPDAVPSPLREQIAHAKTAALDATAAILENPDALEALDWSHESAREVYEAIASAAVDAVLPLVEAERAAELAAERLRLHTQLTALEAAWPGSRALRDVRVMLDVAATPQPEEHP